MLFRYDFFDLTAFFKLTLKQIPSLRVAPPHLGTYSSIWGRRPRLGFANKSRVFEFTFCSLYEIWCDQRSRKSSNQPEAKLRQSTMRERGGDSPQGRLQVGEYSRHCLANLRIE